MSSSAVSRLWRGVTTALFVGVVLVTSYLAVFVPTIGLAVYFGQDCEVGLFRSYCDLDQAHEFVFEKYAILILLGMFLCIAFYRRLKASPTLPLIAILTVALVFCATIDVVFTRNILYYSEIIHYLYYSAILLSAFSFIFIAIIMDIRLRHTVEYIGLFNLYVILVNVVLFVCYVLKPHFPGALSLLFLFAAFAFFIFPIHLMGVARLSLLSQPVAQR